MSELKPCPYCGREPKLTIRPLLTHSLVYHIDCINDDCPRKPGTWYYYNCTDAVLEWGEIASKKVDE